MKEMDATEESYKNGYKQGVKHFAEKLKVKVKSRYKLLGSGTCYGDIEYEIEKIFDELTEEDNGRKD